ncbi:hypothetical protein CHS0354_006228 [Potamilus streckersoni]|uniref:cystathionine gamma-lyase n=1 Tax=Potamilus streckersoni TaxID=2493646 RepID=A0AAE0S3R4_9BIVA|nr:hypothetical protein CHS0354_006228 [Potamilus streckersoni]
MSTFQHFATCAAHVGQEPEQWNSMDIVPPISMTSTFIQEEPDNRAEYFYSRVNNPTRQCVEKCIAALEGGKHGKNYPVKLLFKWMR